MRVCQRSVVCCLLSCYAGDMCEKRGYGPITLREQVETEKERESEAAARRQMGSDLTLSLLSHCLC